MVTYKPLPNYLLTLPEPPKRASIQPFLVDENGEIIITKDSIEKEINNSKLFILDVYEYIRKIEILFNDIERLQKNQPN